MDLASYLEQLEPAGSEAAYERLTGYGFARRYVEGKVVADIGRESVGLGSRLLAESASSVTGFVGSAEAVDLASTAYPAPNVEYREADPSDLPYPEDHFDVVVALGMVEESEYPDELIREVRRVLKDAGVLVVSVHDRGTCVSERQGLYVSEFRQLLEGHFERAHMYWLGAVAGGLVSPESGEMASVSIESASLALSDPRPGAGFPTTCSVVAVCSRAGTFEREEGPYLLLDRDRRVFDECKDRAEDTELLRQEIQRMQETEVQAFQDTLKLHRTEIAYLRAQLRHARAQEQAVKNQLRHARAQEQAVKNQLRHARNQLHAMESSTTWRLFEPYRRLRERIDYIRRTSGDTGGSSDER